jgi:hypothetical protein
MSVRYAIVDIATNTCINVTMDEPGRSFELINDGKWFLFESPTSNIGQLWNGTKLIEAPPPVIEPIIYRKFTKLEFRNLFTLPERVAIDNFELSTTVTSDHKMTLRTLFKDQEAASYIDLDRPDTQQGIGFLAVAGLITPTRANEVLAATNSHDGSK